MSSTLELVDVHSGYGKSEVLHGVSLRIGAGEVVSLLGRNGMGKSTTLRTIVGLLQLRAGDILFEGRQLQDLPTDEISRMGISLVPEHRAIFGLLSVEENIRIAERRNAPWNLHRVYTEFPRLKERRSNLGSALSGGEQQMLSLARALVQGPKVLLLDEATEGLAPVIVDEIVEVIRDQAGKLLHMCGSDYYNQPQADLAQRLCNLWPGKSPTRVFFTNSGAESIEGAFKLARYQTGRQRVIAFLGAFHGRTFGALSLTGSRINQRAHFAPLVPEVEHVPYGDVSYIEKQLFKRTVPPDEVAAIFVEPLQGEGGYIVPPKRFLPDLRKLVARLPDK